MRHVRGYSRGVEDWIPALRGPAACSLHRRHSGNKVDRGCARCRQRGFWVKVTGIIIRLALGHYKAKVEKLMTGIVAHVAGQ